MVPLDLKPRPWETKNVVFVTIIDKHSTHHIAWYATGKSHKLIDRPSDLNCDANDAVLAVQYFDDTAVVIWSCCFAFERSKYGIISYVLLTYEIINHVLRSTSRGSMSCRRLYNFVRKWWSDEWIRHMVYHVTVVDPINNIKGTCCTIIYLLRRRDCWEDVTAEWKHWKRQGSDDRWRTKKNVRHLTFGKLV